ncbi:MAG: flagellar motor switch protein FliN [Candidatus Zixiibacteriota bacterium]
MAEELSNQDGVEKQDPVAAVGGGAGLPAEEQVAPQPAASPTTPAETAAGPGIGNDDLEAAWADALADSQTAIPDVAAQAGIKDPAMDFGGAGTSAAHPAVAHPAEFPQFGDSPSGGAAGSIDMLLDVKLPVSIELGRTTLPIGDILCWGPGSIVELDKLAGEPVNLLVNNVLVARGEVVVVDENFGLRITSLLTPKERSEIV